MNLKEELMTRNKISQETSRAIIKKYGLLFDKLFDKIVSSRMTVSWIAIDFHQRTKRLVNIIGMAKHAVGEVVTTEYEEVVYIDETNVDNYTKTVLVVAPIHAVDNADIDGMISFATEYSELARNVSLEEIDLMVADDKFLEKQFTVFGGINKSNTTTPFKHEYEGFDLSKLELDEIQIKQLKLTRPEGQS